MTQALRFVSAVVWRDWQLSLTSRVPFLFDLLGIFGAMAIYFFVGRFVRPVADVGGLGFFAFTTGGIAVMRLQAAFAKTIYGVDREQASGTLELLLIAPVPGWLVAVASSVYEIVRGLVFALVVLLVSRFVFGAGLTLGPRGWAGLACGLAGAAICFLLLAMIGFCVLITIKQGPAFAGLLGLALPVLSGAFFPPKLLPQPIEAIATASPLTMAIDLVRNGVVRATFSVGDAATMLGVLVVATPLTLWLCSASVRRARRLGSLGQQ